MVTGYIHTSGALINVWLLSETLIKFIMLPQIIIPFLFVPCLIALPGTRADISYTNTPYCSSLCFPWVSPATILQEFQEAHVSGCANSHQLKTRSGTENMEVLQTWQPLK